MSTQSGTAGATPSATVVVITWNRPDFVRDCLQHLEASTTKPSQILVVDASADDRTSRAVAGFPAATHLAFPAGAGHMTRSRNEALLHADADVIAYLDDDANVRPEWLSSVLKAFADPTVGAVAGRTCNGQPGEDLEGIDAIGRFLPNGELTGHFAANPPATVEVDHGIGANMSFRREVLAALGGFRDDYAGTALREDTDIFLRVRALGWRAVFTPFAIADHVAAPHVKGRRFDRRYQFWAYHNHMLLLGRFRGSTSRVTLTWAGAAFRRSFHDVTPRNPRSLTRPLVAAAGLLLGSATALRAHRREPGIVRNDLTGHQIRQHLSRATGWPPAHAGERR